MDTGTLKEGTILHGNEDYRVIEVLGRGGFGITYLAQNISGAPSQVAIKEYAPLDFVYRQPDSNLLNISDQCRDDFEYGLTRFRSEASLLQLFQGRPDIVGVNDYFSENGTAYFAMPYVGGKSLLQLLERRGGTLDVPETLRLIIQLSAALKVVHQCGLIHRDISPDNIILRQDGRPCLIDFGAAREDTRHVSRNLSVILKLGYAPEEQYRSSGKQGPWTDVYALGATMYRCLTGRLPPQALDRLDDDTLIAPSNLGISLPSGIERALLKALSIKASDRFVDMAAMQQALLHELIVYLDLPSFTIGRSSKSNVVLADESVSRRHASIAVLSDDYFIIEDLQSSYGSFYEVSGFEMQPIDISLVPRWDSIRFGDLSFPGSMILEAIGQQEPAPQSNRAQDTDDPVSAEDTNSLLVRAFEAREHQEIREKPDSPSHVSSSRGSAKGCLPIVIIVAFIAFAVGSTGFGVFCLVVGGTLLLAGDSNPQSNISHQGVSLPLHHASPVNNEENTHKTIALSCLSGEYAGNNIIIPPEGIVIGRDPTRAQLVMNDNQVSRVHLHLIPNPSVTNEIMAWDLSSTAGTEYFDKATNEWLPLIPTQKYAFSSKIKIRIASGVATFELIAVT